MSNQEYTHAAIDGIVRDASTRPDGVREIHDFELHSISLTPAEQALYPSWRALEANTGIRRPESCQRRPPSPEGLDNAIRVLAEDLAAAHSISIEQAEIDIRYAIERLKEQNSDEGNQEQN